MTRRRSHWIVSLLCFGTLLWAENRETQESLEEQRRILSRETELGLALAIDLSQAEITVSEERIELLNLKADLEEAEQQLAESLGLWNCPRFPRP